MRKIAFIPVIVLFIVACSNKNKLPKGILSKQQMEDVLWDLVKANEYINGFVFNKDTSLDRTSETLKWYDNVYRIHNTTKTEFEKSYAYYREHSTLMDEVLDSLTHRKPPSARPAEKDTTRATDSQSRKKILQPANFRKYTEIDSLRRRKGLLHRPNHNR